VAAVPDNIDNTDKTQAVDASVLGRVRQSAHNLVPGLLVLSGGELGKVFYFDEDGKTIGRDTDAGISLRHSSVSRRHAQVYKEKAEDCDAMYYVVVDLHSTNGTLVNGDAISRTFLHDGDKIQVGEITLKFTLHDEAEHRYQQEMQRRINFDDLTGLLTINCFYDRFDLHLKQAQARRSSFSVIMMDLDGLKRVNELHGHLAGSRTIKTIGKLLLQKLGDFAEVGRYGGDEFAAFAPDLKPEDVLGRLENLRGSIENSPLSFKGQKAGVTISIGVANYPWDGHSREELVRAADVALMLAKEQGKNRIAVYEAE
jgi:two-component system cell cycle response regulator